MDRHQDPKMDPAETMASGAGLTLDTGHALATGPVAVSYGAFQRPALDLAAAALTSGDSDGRVGKAQNR